MIKRCPECDGPTIWVDGVFETRCKNHLQRIADLERRLEEETWRADSLLERLPEAKHEARRDAYMIARDAIGFAPRDQESCIRVIDNLIAASEPKATP